MLHVCVLHLEMSGLPSLERLLTEGKKSIDLLEVLPSGESTLLLPTPIGLPVSVNASFMGIMRLSGYLELVGMPSIRELLNGRLIPDTVKMKTNTFSRSVCDNAVYFCS